MHKSAILFAFLLLLAGAIQSNAQGLDKGYWHAASNSASSITGDIAIGDAKLTLNMTVFSLAPIRTLKPAEVSAVFDADANTAGTGSLYRLRVPATLKLLHHNTLCGSDVTEWMTTYLSGKTLRVAFFSGDDAPEFTFDAIANSTRLCGTFTYER